MAHFGVLPVQVRLLAGEQVQVVLAGGLVPGPHRAGEQRLPVRRLGARCARRRSRPGVAPPVPVPFRVVAAGPGLGEPRVLVGGVVHHQVHDQPHAAGVEGRDQLIEIGERAEQRVDVLVVADVVAIVVHRRPVDRGQPERRRRPGLQVIQVGEDAAQVANAVRVGVGKAPRIDLVDHPSPPRLTEPGPGGHLQAYIAEFFIQVGPRMPLGHREHRGAPGRSRRVERAGRAWSGRAGSGRSSPRPPRRSGRPGARSS